MPKDKKAEIYQFRLRLESLLFKKGKTLSPTALARDFNLRWRGVPVTVNATRKWLQGQAIPTMDKLTVLANMLNTSEEWLRWGDEDEQKMDSNQCYQFENSSTVEVSQVMTSFAQDFKLLNNTNQMVVNAVMEVLLNAQRSAVKS
jgi:transcriptional regulator with XRE-family HTH domain